MIGKSYSSSPFDDPDRMGGTADDAPEPEKPAHPLDSAESKSLWQQLTNWFTQENERQAHNRFQMALDEDYYDAMQWTEEDAQILMERGQAPLVLNEIKPTIDWVIGTERRTRIDHKVLARKKEGVDDAEIKTQLLKYLSDTNKTPFHRSYAFTDAVKSGMGVLETGLRGDSSEELLFTRHEDWRNCLRDSNSKEPDGSDARYFFRWKHIDEDVAYAYFPERKDVIREAVINGVTMNGSEDEDEIWYMGARVTASGEDFAPVGKYRPYSGSAYANSARNRVKLIECWYTKPVPVKKFNYGPATGQVFDQQNPEHAEFARAGFSLFDQVEMQVWCAIYTKAGLVYHGRSPYKHNRIPFVIVRCYVRKRDNAPYGLIRNLRDPQDDLNKRASKSLHILSSVKIVMDENAVDDVEELRNEAARPDGIIVKKPNKMLEMRTDTQLAEAHVRLMERDVVHIRNVGGVNSENLGRETNASSGIAIQARQEQGSIVTTEVFDNLRFAVQSLGEMELSNVEQFYDQPKTMRIVGERGAAKFVELNAMGENGEIINNITALHADFVVSEQDFRSNLRQAMFESMFDLVSRLAQMNPMVALNLLDLVVEMADLPNRDEFVSRIRKLSGQRDPDSEPTPEEIQADQAAAQQGAMTQKIQSETLAAQLRKLQAEGAGLDADAVLKKLDGMLRALEAAQIVAVSTNSVAVADEMLNAAGNQDNAPPIPEPEQSMPQEPMEAEQPVQEPVQQEIAEPVPDEIAIQPQGV